MLQAEHLRFIHPGATRQFDLSLVAKPGEITAVSGQSGSGKSTLLDLIAGFLVPSAGRLTLAGQDLLPLPPEQRPISILFQSETLFEHLSAYQNLELGLPRGVTGGRQKIEAALNEVGLPGVLKQRADTLSGGEKQRVALARTLLRDRPVLLLDEPFSALDDDTRGTIRTLVKSLTERQQWITLLVSHHVDDVEALATRRYQLRDGMLFEG
ncbi:ATP-binding cassette domain-containing protein [Devosia sp. LjRoot16]|uniref:ATP-binding cassette domain-containing protein n=1 Tax=Devosia sp. LjRoot16 TaxID=3342271 RepID=UPI003ED0A94A